MQRTCAVNPVYAYFGDYFRFMHLKNMVQRKPFCNVRSVRETDGLCPASSFHSSQNPTGQTTLITALPGRSHLTYAMLFKQHLAPPKLC